MVRRRASKYPHSPDSPIPRRRDAEPLIDRPPDSVPAQRLHTASVAARHLHLADCRITVFGKDGNPGLADELLPVLLRKCRNARLTANLDPSSLSLVAGQTDIAIFTFYAGYGSAIGHAIQLLRENNPSVRIAVITSHAFVSVGIPDVDLVVDKTSLYDRVSQERTLIPALSRMLATRPLRQNPTSPASDRTSSANGQPSHSSSWFGRRWFDRFLQSRKNSRLLAAARDGDMPKLHKALDAGAEINARDATGATALIIAVRRKHSQTAELLLDQGAAARLCDNAGMGAAYYADRSGDPFILRVFRRHGLI